MNFLQWSIVHSGTLFKKFYLELILRRKNCENSMRNTRMLLTRVHPHFAPFASSRSFFSQAHVLHVFSELNLLLTIKTLSSTQSQQLSKQMSKQANKQKKSSVNQANKKPQTLIFMQSTIGILVCELALCCPSWHYFSV